MFAGFMQPQDKVELVSVPAAFFSELLPTITNLSELKVTLHIVLMLSRKHGFPKGVSYHELRSDPLLLTGLKGQGNASSVRPAEELLAEGLELAVARGTLLCLAVRLPASLSTSVAKGEELAEGVGDDPQPAAEPVLVKIEQAKPGALEAGKRRTRKELCYMVNTPWNREVVQQWKGGEIDLAGIDLGLEATYKAEAERKVRRGRVAVVKPNIFALYEQNIGVLTPLLAEQLTEAERVYPSEWIEAAFVEAVSYNKRSWRYIERILQKWQTEGKGNGKSQRGTEGHLDADKYTTGKYAHIFQRQHEE